jgi:hypothetical protein
MIFRVGIFYKGALPPKVYLLRPMLADNAPHVYRKDGSLCVYYFADWTWSEDKHLASTIVPWTIVWLYFYEIWLETGEWLGDEAPHKSREVKSLRSDRVCQRVA